MKSKLIIVVSILMAFVTTASAQQVGLNYYMGNINLGNGNTIIPVQSNPINNNPINTNISGSTTNSTCVAYLNNYQRFGDYSQEVAKLQNFLNDFNGAKLNGLGYYGNVTTQEVKNLQYTYGLKVTGVQHEKTTLLINSLKCGQTLKKERKVFVAMNSYGTMQTKIDLENIYPNPTINKNINEEIVKNYDNKTTTKNQPMTGKVGTNTKEKVAGGTNFFENLKNDWDKIKENYKAYLLVFLLVLALFWFLRKAATE